MDLVEWVGDKHRYIGCVKMSMLQFVYIVYRLIH